jgi:hypothetical protein
LEVVLQDQGGDDTKDSDIDPMTYRLSVPALLPNETSLNHDAGFKPAAVFPIELLEFSAIQKGKDGLLNWTTTAEVNSGYFQIQRSIDNGLTFEALGDVAARGSNLNQSTNYDFTDKNIVAIHTDKLLYRLKMVDIDGTFAYSNVASLNLSEQEAAYVNAFPNPAKDHIRLVCQFYDLQWVNIQITNELGQVVHAQGVSGEVLPAKLDIDVHNWTQGVYYIHLFRNGTLATTKFIKE